MNESKLSEAMEDATQRLSPQVDQIVRGAMDDGRRQVRRRRRSTALVSFAVIAAVGVGGGAWLRGTDGDKSSPVADTRVAASPSTSASPNPAGNAGQRRLISTEEMRDGVVAMLAQAGKVTNVKVDERDYSNRDGSLPVVEISALVDGTAFRVYWMDMTGDVAVLRANMLKDPGPKPNGCVAQPDYRAMKKVAQGLSGRTNGPIGPEENCVLWNYANLDRQCAQAPTCEHFEKTLAWDPKTEACGFDQEQLPCRPWRNGAWLAEGASDGDGYHTRTKWMHVSELATVDGWAIYASSSNRLPEGEKPLMPRPPLTTGQVTAIVTSNAWFQ